MNSNLKKFITGSFTAYLNMFITIIISIFSVPLMLSSLGKSSYGLWISVSSLFGFMTISDLGIGQSASKLIAEKKDDKRNDFIDKELVSTTFFTNFIIGLIVLVINIIFSLFVYKILNLAMDQRLMIGLVYALLSINFFAGFMSNTFRSILLGYKYISVLNIINLLRTIFNFLSLIVLFKYTNKLYNVAIIQLILTIISGITFILAIKYLRIKVTIKLKYFSFNTLKKIGMPGIYFLILQISSLIANNTDNLILNYFLSSAVVVIYSTGFKMTNIFLQMVFTIVDNLFPFISELHGRRDTKRIKDIFIICEKYSIYIGVVIMFTMIIFGKNIMQIWIGEENYLGFYSMVLFAIFLLLNIINHGPIVFLQSMYKHSVIAKIALLESIVNVILSVILVRKFGAMGVIMGTVISDVFLMFWYATYKTLKLLGISLNEFISILNPSIKLTLLLIIVSALVKAKYILISNNIIFFIIQYLLYIVAIIIFSLYIEIISVKVIKSSLTKLRRT